MNHRILFAALTISVLSACTDATGQKDPVVLRNNIDSVSYGLGTDIGNNLRMQLQGELLDTLNTAALTEGIRDALDSTERMTADNVRELVQAFMLDAQKRMLAKEENEAAENLRKGQEFLAENGQRPEVKTTESGLQYEVLQAGKGTAPGATDRVTVNYRGTLLDGTEFDSSYKRGEPAQFGVDQVIAGWTGGVACNAVHDRYRPFRARRVDRGPAADAHGLPVQVLHPRRAGLWQEPRARWQPAPEQYAGVRSGAAGRDPEQLDLAAGTTWNEASRSGGFVVHGASGSGIQCVTSPKKWLLLPSPSQKWSPVALPVLLGFFRNQSRMKRSTTTDRCSMAPDLPGRYTWLSGR